MELILIRLIDTWLIFIFLALAVKFYKLYTLKHRSKPYYELRSCMAFMFLLSALVFMIALANTFTPVAHYGLKVGVIMTLATIPFWNRVQ